MKRVLPPKRDKYNCGDLFRWLIGLIPCRLSPFLSAERYVRYNEEYGNGFAAFSVR
ncbi:MAG: hypothetical protein LBT20_02880 [Clostridiales bacterium]|nr:hypothetical protein [Clostridiales bacterium]